MAKKENNAIGYAVLAVIPLIGLIWAISAGVSHNKYVNECKKAEDKFEAHLVEKMNALANDDSSLPTINEKLNITCILPITYSSKLLADNVSTSKQSHTIKIGANPITKKSTNANGKEIDVIDYYQFEYEFFITDEVYQDVTENFLQEKLVVEGIEDYTFTTYYEHNPRRAPIYKLNKYFDKYYSNVNKYTYNGVAYIETGASSVIELIDALDITNITDTSDTDLKQIAKTYELLTEEEKEKVTNYDIYVQARKICDVKMLETKVNKKIASVESLTWNLRSSFEGFIKDYDKIEDEYKSYYTTSDTLFDSMRIIYGKSIDYVIESLDNEYADKQVKNAVTYYNNLVSYCSSFDQVKSYILDGNYDKLVAYVATYNEGKTTTLSLDEVSE